jgi:hypothetical protein
LIPLQFASATNEFFCVFQGFEVYFLSSSEYVRFFLLSSLVFAVIILIAASSTVFTKISDAFDPFPYDFS